MQNGLQSAWILVTTTVLKPRETLQCVQEANLSTQAAQTFVAFVFVFLLTLDRLRSVIFSDVIGHIGLMEVAILRAGFCLFPVFAWLVLFSQRPQNQNEMWQNAALLSVGFFFWGAVYALELALILIAPIVALTLVLIKWLVFFWLTGHAMALINNTTPNSDELIKNVGMMLAMIFLGLILSMMLVFLLSGTPIDTNNVQ